MKPASQPTVNQAIGLARSGKTTGAVNVLRAILEDDPRNLKALLALGAFTPNVEEGVIALERALELDPENDAVRRALAELRAQRQELEASVGDSSAPAGDDVGDGSRSDQRASVASTRHERGVGRGGDGLRVIQGSQYHLQRRRREHRQSAFIGTVLLALLVVALVVGLAPLAAWILRIGAVSPMWIISGLLVAAVVWLALPGANHLRDEWRNFRAGRLAEERLVALLQERLRGEWILFRDVVLPESKEDIDAVLVGPRGVFALEVAASFGHYRNVGEVWRWRAYGRWHTLERNPTREARRNAAALTEYLERCGVDAEAEARVVWAGDSSLWLQKPAVRVWRLSQPRHLLDDVLDERRVSERVLNSAVRALEGARNRMENEK